MLEKSLKLINQISDFGYEAYIVGGFPRDQRLGRDTKDVDICTNATPMEIMKLFPDAESLNSEYGIVVVMFENTRFEITTFRKEKNYINSRRPSKIEYIDSLAEDLQRRDFTINTLCINKMGSNIDLLGAGKDIDNQLIKMIGDPKIRLKEDALRILRAVRLATTLNFNLDERLKTYIKKYAYLLKKLSYDRKREELDRIFSSTNCERGIKLLCELKLIDVLEIPKLKNIKITPTSIVMWAQLDVLDKYKFTSSEKEFISIIKKLKDVSVLNKKILYEYGLYECSLVAELQEVDKTELTKMYNEMPIHNKLDIALKPVEICEILEKTPGEFLRKLIKDLEDKILSGIVKNEKEDIKNYILEEKNKY